jgi:hypothetical protein
MSSPPGLALAAALASIIASAACGRSGGPLPVGVDTAVSAVQPGRDAGGPADAAAPVDARPAADDAASDRDPAGVTIVSARQVKVWIGERGERAVPDDLSASEIGAWVEDPPGQWRFIEGHGDDQGQAEVSVPMLPYLLQINSTYLAADALRTFDLTYRAFGSPDRVRPAVGPAPISLTLSGLSPWQAADRLTFHTPAIAELEGWLHQKLMPAPGPGATALGASGDLASFTDPALVDGPTRGEDLWIGQLAVTSTGLRPFLSVQRIWRSREVKMIDGQPTALAATLIAVPQTETVTIDWPAADYQAAISETSPMASRLRGQLEVLAAPAALSFSDYQWNVNLLLAPLDGDAPARFEVRFGDPYPRTWERVARLRVEYDTPATVPGVRPGILTGWTTVTDSLAGLTAGPLKPLVTPVRDLQINGRPAASMDLTSVTSTPLFTWSPPAVGAPSLYRMWLYRVERQPEGLRWRQIASLMTADTRLRLPPGLLEAGQSYSMTVEARVGEGLSVAAPYKCPARSGRASVWTGVFQP